MEQLVKFFESFWFDKYQIVSEQDEVNSQGSQEAIPPETLNIEEIIESAQSIYIPGERLKALFEKHKLRESALKV